MKKANTKKLVQMAKLKTEYTKQKVINTINKMVKNGERITFYGVYSKAKVSKSFVYRNKEIRTLIEKYRGSSEKKIQTEDAKDVIIKSLRLQIKELKGELKKNKKDELWKDKYTKLLKENKELKRQHEKLYAQLYNKP